MSAYKSGKSTSTGGSRNGAVFHLFVGGLGCQMDADQVKAYFERYMEIDYIKMTLNKDGNPRGCCSIRFVQEPSQELLDKLYSGRHVIGDRTLEVKPFNPNQQQLHQDRQEENARSVMIFNLHPDVRTEDLKQALEKAIGPICKADVVVESNGKSKCFGHATFVSEKHATYAKSFQKLKIKGHNATIRDKRDRNEVKNSRECSGANSVHSGPGYSNDYYPNCSGTSAHSVMSDQRSVQQSGKSIQSAASMNSGVHETNRHSMGFASAHSVGAYPDQLRRNPVPYNNHAPSPHQDPYAGVTFEDMGMGGFYLPNGCEQQMSRPAKPATANYPHGGSGPYSCQMNLPKTVPRMSGYPGQPPVYPGWQQGCYDYQDPRLQGAAYPGTPQMHPYGHYASPGSQPHPSHMGPPYPNPQYGGHPGHPGYPGQQMHMMSPGQGYPVNDGSTMRKSTGMASLGNDSRAQTAKSISQMSDFPATSNGAYGKHLETNRELKKQNNLNSLMQTARPEHQQMGCFSSDTATPSPTRQGFTGTHQTSDPKATNNPNPKPVKHDASSDSLDALKGIFSGSCTPQPGCSAIQPPCNPDPAKPKPKGILETAACKMKQYCLWGTKKCDGKDPSQK